MPSLRCGTAFSKIQRKYHVLYYDAETVLYYIFNFWLSGNNGWITIFSSESLVASLAGPVVLPAEKLCLYTMLIFDGKPYTLIFYRLPSRHHSYLPYPKIFTISKYVCPTTPNCQESTHQRHSSLPSILYTS